MCFLESQEEKLTTLIMKKLEIIREYLETIPKENEIDGSI